MCRRTLLNDFPRKNCKSWKGSDLTQKRSLHNQIDETLIVISQSDRQDTDCDSIRPSLAQLRCTMPFNNLLPIRNQTPMRQWRGGQRGRKPYFWRRRDPCGALEPPTLWGPLWTPLTTATCHHISVFILMSLDYQGQSNIMPRMPKQTRSTLVWLGIRELGETEM